MEKVIEKASEDKKPKRTFVAKVGKKTLVSKDEVKARLKTALKESGMSQKDADRIIEKASLSYQQNTSATNVLGYQDLNELNGIEIDITTMVDLSIKMYKINGLYADIIDTLTNLICSGLIISSTGNEEYDKKYRLFIRDFNKKLNYAPTGLKNYIYDMVRESLKCGNTYFGAVDFTSYQSKIKKKSLKESPSENIEYEDVSIQLPNVINFNPKKIQIDSSFITENTGVLKYNNIERNDIFQMAFRKSMYSLYGVPFISKILNELYSYLLTLNMDNSQMEDLIQLFLLIMIPDDLIDDADEIVSTVTAARRSNLPLGLNHDIEVKAVGVRNEFNDLTPKIKESRSRVIKQAGLSESLLYGLSQDANEHTISLHIAKVVANVEEYQSVLVSSVRKVFELFAEKNDIDIVPEVEMSKTILKLFLLDRYFIQMYDRGLLSGIQLVEQAGFNHTEVIFAMQEEVVNKYAQFGFGVKKDLPYYGNKGADPSDTTNPDDDDKKGERK